MYSKKEFIFFRSKKSLIMSKSNVCFNGVIVLIEELNLRFADM